ncbi:MAG: hypothetical protein Q9177_004525 [Variospora cf. flavescens]
MKNARDEILRHIGEGACGSVWAAPTGSESICAVKREDGGKWRSIYNDFVMHRELIQTLSASESSVQIPTCHEYIKADDWAWWDECITMFPIKQRERCNLLITERIPPFPQHVRDAIVDLYCPESLRATIKASEANKDCLVRLYLGRRRRLEKTNSKFHGFTLRNFPLQQDQVEALGLDGGQYARIMAETLAEFYWSAHIDANDVEFVLAPSRANPSLESGSHKSPGTIFRSHLLGEHVLWVLDFDCCKHMSLDEAGVEQAVKAFYKNDPYFPRPGRDNVNDQALWREFKGCFMEKSNVILGHEGPEARLPALWLDMVEQRSRK